MARRIFANLGFLLQISGVLTILPIAVGFYFNEGQNLISLFLTCTGFLVCGFLANAMCERKNLDFKSATTLTTLSFVILPLMGALPFVYLDPFNSLNLADRFTNGYFESVSGYTTTGFSLILNTEDLPRSLLVYRSLTELMGGVGIVYLLLAFFHSRDSLKNIGNVLGVETFQSNLKRMFFSIFVVYCGIILVFTAILYLLGFTDLVRTGSFVIDTITGGFSNTPTVQQSQQYLDILPKICMILLMLIGALSFTFNYRILTGKFRKAFNAEIGVFLLIIAVGTVLVFWLSKMQSVDALFHVLSMSSTAGFDYLNISKSSDTVKSIFLTLMLIGGCTFSMAGGIRVATLISFAGLVKQSVKKVTIKENATEENAPIKENATEENVAEPPKRQGVDNGRYVLASISIVLFVFTLAVFSIVFSTIGVSFADALFEIGSALTTTGLSTGITTTLMPLPYKWLLVAAMIIGRVEVMSILIAVCPYETRKPKRDSKHMLEALNEDKFYNSNR